MIATSWGIASGVATLTLVGFHFSVIAKYTTPLHMAFVCLSAAFFSWQTILYQLITHLSLSFAATHAFSYYRDVPLKNDPTTELPDLRNQLLAIHQGPPYNCLGGRFYPQQSMNPFAAIAHIIDLIWRYLNQRPAPNIEEAKQHLKARAHKMWEHLRSHSILNEVVKPEEPQLLYWITYIAPIDRPKYNIPVHPAALTVRVMLNEPLPTGDLAQLPQGLYYNPGHPLMSVSSPPKYPDVGAWVQVCNTNPALTIELLAKAFTERWDVSQAHRLIFFLMRDYGLAHKDSPLAHQIQADHVLPTQLLDNRKHLPNTPAEACGTYDSQLTDNIGWGRFLLQCQREGVTPQLPWDAFTFISNSPDLSTPFFPSQHVSAARWAATMIASLLKGLDPFDPSQNTRWRLHLIHLLTTPGTEEEQKRCSAFTRLCYLSEHTNKPCFWSYVYRKDSMGMQIPSAYIPLYQSWQEQWVLTFIQAVKRTYQLTDDQKTLRCIAKAFWMEWQETTSPLRVLAHLEHFSPKWGLQVLERALARLQTSGHELHQLDTS